MKAYRIESFGSVDGVVLGSRDDPRPGTREILVRVRATSLNYRDLMVLKGGGRGPTKLGVVPLSDGAGEVAAVGDGVIHHLQRGINLAQDGLLSRQVDDPAEDQPGKRALGPLPVSVRERLIVRQTAEYAQFGIVEHLPGAQFWIDDEIACAVPEVDKVLRDAR